MILVGHETNLGRQIYNGRHAYLTKGYNLRSLQSAMELLQIAIAQFITKCDGQLLQIGTAFLLQSATWFIKNCDSVLPLNPSKVFIDPPFCSPKDQVISQNHPPTPGDK